MDYYLIQKKAPWTAPDAELEDLILDWVLMDDTKLQAAYLAAKGGDTIEVAYLDGQDTPWIEQQEGFTVDGVTTKVRIDAGVSALDYRGLVKSAGK